MIDKFIAMYPQVTYLKLFSGSIPYGVLENIYSKHTKVICQRAAESCTPMVCLQ